MDKPVISSSRKFNPLAIKKKGKWLPIQRFYNRALKNLETQAKVQIENYKIRGTILPLKRYYNPELMLFSDEPIKRSAVIREGFAHVVVAFDYPNIRWISGRHIKVEFRRGMRADEIKEKIERIEELAEENFARDFPKARGGVQVLMVDGFIPTKFGGARHGKKKIKKKSK